jgi:hypothetical protein
MNELYAAVQGTLDAGLNLMPDEATKAWFIYLRD